MRPSGELAAERRRSNAKALGLFGASAAAVREPLDSILVSVRTGPGATLFTIGYEKRSGQELIDLLLDAGVEILADVRQKAMSRKPGFSGKALKAQCEAVGIDYQWVPELGSTNDQRTELHRSGDFGAFSRQFRDLARRTMTEPISRLAELASSRVVALLCYERQHSECHRSIIADLVADQTDGGIVAIQ